MVLRIFLFFSELVRDHRRLTKEMRELDHSLRSELHLASERGMARGRYELTLISHFD